MKKQTTKAPAKAKAPDTLEQINKRLRTIDVQTTRLSVSILRRIDDLERLIGTITDRASVTAKELGLEPKKMEACPKIKVGDWVVLTAKSGLFSYGDISKVCRIGPQGGVYLDRPNTIHGSGVERKDIRPATDAEITEHLAKLEAAKPVVFGTWVEFEGDKGWRVASDVTASGLYISKDGKAIWAKRSEFTVLDPQPQL